MRKLVILIVVVAVITAATAYAAGMFGLIGHTGLVRGDIGKWVHDQVQVSILAPVAQIRLQALSPRPQTEKDAPAATAWQVVWEIKSAISFLVGTIRLVVIIIRVWRRRQLAGGQTLTLLAQLRSAFLGRGGWYRMGSIVS